MDFSQRILGYIPIENGRGNYIQQLTLDYESGLVRKLSEQMGSSAKDQMQLNNLTEEILLNATFSNLVKIPVSQVQIIMTDVLNCLK